MHDTFYIVVAYMAVMIGIALYVSKRKVKNSKDFHLAGRSLGPMMMAGTLAAAEIGGGSTVGVAAKAYGDWGLSAGWYVVCSGVGIFLVSFVAPFLRNAMATTVPEILERRYGKPTHIITTVLSITTLFIATAVQIIATASIITAITGVDLKTITIVVGLVVMCYTLLGGLVSVAFTDIVHIIFITVGMAIAMPIILHNAGGWEFITKTLPPEQLSLTKVGWQTIIGLILMYFMTFSTGQEAVQRYFAARNARVAKLGSFLCSILMAVYGFIPAIIGLCALAHFPNINPNTAMATAASHFAPTIIAGLVMASVVAATMSSASGNLIAVSTLFTKDIYERYLNPEATDKQIMLWSKIAIVIVALSGLVIALNNVQIIPLMVIAFTLRSAGPFAAFIFGFLYPRATRNAGFGSIIIGSLAALIWQLSGEPYGVMSIVFGSTFSFISFFVIAKIDHARGIAPAPPAISEENMRESREADD